MMSEHEKRRDDRMPVLWHGQLVTEDDQSYPCEVVDVSLAGTLVVCDAPIEMGQELLLTIEGLGDFASVVKWQGSKQLGLMIIVGPDLALKKFAEGSGSGLSDKPLDQGADPLVAEKP